jgi:nucleoid-associated protein YgaU
MTTAAAPFGRSVISPRRAIVVPVVALAIAAAAAGCLPAGTRGRGSGDAGGATEPTRTAVAAPSGPSPSPSFLRPTPTPGPSFVVYTVKAGDSLNSIAHHFETTGRSIAYWNGATYPSLDPESPKYEPGLLKVGWTLQILPHVTFDEQTLPEPSDLIDDDASAEPTDADASG